MECKGTYWLQLAISQENSVESARWCAGNPKTEDVLIMLKDIEQYGSDVLVAGDGASYNRGVKTTIACVELTGEPMAIVPPMSPFLSCIESVNRLIK